MFQKNKARQITRITNFLPPNMHTYVCVSGSNKCSFFGKFGMLCFLETLVLRCVLLPYYRRTRLFQLGMQMLVLRTKLYTEHFPTLFWFLLTILSILSLTVFPLISAGSQISTAPFHN